MNTKLNPTIYSPANDEWVQADDVYPLMSDAARKACVSTTNIPLGIAMWKPMAVALGWPERAISFRDIMSLAMSSTGWGSLGYPQWGTFKFGHGHAKYSNSGRLTVTAALYAFNNISANTALTSAMVSSIVSLFTDNK